ncbi:MAG: hypothetical protein H0X16_10575 [Chloroflexi bacterium]|nr:hypothetical protein [Chloroflexota bacterium]
MDRALLLVEVKTRLVDLQDLLSTFGRKLRIVPPLLAQERGWRAVNLGHLVVIADGSTNRRVVARHAAISAQRFRSVAARLDPGCASHASRWLRCGSCHRCALRIASSKPDMDFCQSCSWRMTGCPEARPDRPDLSPMPPAHP